MKEIEAFLSANPSEIVALILEDYVQAPNGLTKVFNESGLLKYWFPVSNMPQNGEDWPQIQTRYRRECLSMELHGWKPVQAKTCSLVSVVPRRLFFNIHGIGLPVERLIHDPKYFLGELGWPAIRIYHIIMAQMPQLSVCRNPEVVTGVSNELQAMACPFFHLLFIWQILSYDTPSTVLNFFYTVVGWYIDGDDGMKAGTCFNPVRVFNY